MVPNIKKTAIATETPFDLNFGKVLEHRTLSFAIREVIANALDEQVMTGTTEPRIFKDTDGRWHIVDTGRGLRYEHLAQNESAEKRRHPNVIGQFGIAVLQPPVDPSRTGTDVVLGGVPDEDIAAVKSFFLRYSDEEILETTKYGQVLAAPPKGRSAHVYVKGLLVAEEENFLFSYNITNLSAPLRRALNRERTNVGRAAYSDRVKSILKECTSGAVAEPLAEILPRLLPQRESCLCNYAAVRLVEPSVAIRTR